MENVCKNCEKLPRVKYSKYSSGEFCSIECSKSYSTKNKRKEINLKVSRTLSGKTRSIDILKICPKCDKEFFVKPKNKNQICCSVICSRNLDSYKEMVSNQRKNMCSNIDERIRMREIGRKGGFGNKGKTKKGIHYQSNFEKKVFEFLDENKIKYEPHKIIPNTSKISDVYLIDLDLWVELDGINREKKKKWLGKDYEYWCEKIKIYQDKQLKFLIVYNFEEFKKVCSSGRVYREIENG